MKNLFICCLQTLLVFAATVATAQVPRTMSYQGRVQVAGTNFSGTGQFKFAIVSTGMDMNRQATAVATVTSGFITSISVTDGGNGYLTAPSVEIVDASGSGAVATAQIANGAVTSISVQSAGSGYSAPQVSLGAPTASPVVVSYWSNDNTGLNGSEPISYVTLSVTEGLFTVMLGDPAAVMTPIPQSAFTQADAHLRIWFNDGVQGFAQLTPDQPLASVGYAMVAAKVPDGSIGSASIAARSITTSNLAQGAITSVEIANNSVLPVDLNVPSFHSVFWKADGNTGTVAGVQYLGTRDNQPLELRVNSRRALRLEPDGDYVNMVVGLPLNRITNGAEGSTISGGDRNRIGADGYFNSIVGGEDNLIDARAYTSLIGGGFRNQIGTNGFYNVIAGGSQNEIPTLTTAGTIPGGENNFATNRAFAAGTQAKAEHTGAFVWADPGDAFRSTAQNQFAVRARGGARFETGGAGVTVDGQAVLSGVVTEAQIGDGAITQSKITPGAVGRSQLADNAVGPLQIEDGAITTLKLAEGAVTSLQLASAAVSSGHIADGTVRADDVDLFTLAPLFWGATGNSNTSAGTHFVGTTDDQALEFKVNNTRALRLEPTVGYYAVNVIGGSPLNFVPSGVVSATIAGGGTGDFSGNGASNTVSADYGSIGGGLRNAIGVGAMGSTIAGGNANEIASLSANSSISGGFNNNIGSGSSVSVIAGGTLNDISSNAALSTISGGNDNNIGANSSGSVIGGGLRNNVGTNSLRSVITGGASNSIAPNSSYAVIAGGNDNLATNRAFAAGTRAKAVHTGAFVWADSINANFASTTQNQFAVRAGGGARFETSGAGMLVDGQPVLTAQITESQLANASVTTAKIGNAAVTAEKIVNGAITSEKLPDRSIGSVKIAENAITAYELGDGSVDSTAVQNNSIMPLDLNLPSFAPVFWKADGNFGTSAGNFVGTTDNQPLEFRVNGTRALWLQPTPSGYPNVIAGTSNSTIEISAYGSTISGGMHQSIGSDATGSVIGGGSDNRIAAVSPASTIAGGSNNDIGTNSIFSSIGGGFNNNVAGDSRRCVIAGGNINDIGITSSYSAIGGGDNNNIGSNSFHCVIAGGGLNDIGYFSAASGISGGTNNNIGNHSRAAVIVGGDANDVGTNSSWSFVGGGRENNIANTAEGSVIIGGFNNIIGNNSFGTIIGGGSGHLAAAVQSSVIGGGYGNSITSVSNAVVAGGSGNSLGVSAHGSVIGGGSMNSIGNGSFAATIGGGTNNVILVSSPYATIPGGDRNAATNRAFAAGTRAKANHTGSFVWADSANADFTSTGNDQFQVRAGGGVNIVSPTEMATLRLTSIGGSPVSWGLSINQSLSSVMTISNGGQPRITMPANGNVGIGVTNPTARLQVINATCDGTTWINGSDRNIKTNFRPVDPLTVLEKVTSLPITRWAYRSTETEDHIGPVAQDFRAAFGLGAGDKGIATVDADGVALAAIQGLNQKLQEQSAQLKRKNAEISSLEARLARLEKLFYSKPRSKDEDNIDLRE